MPFSLIKSSRNLIVVVSLTIIVVLALFNLGSWIFFNRIESLLESELERRLKAVAKIGAELIENSEFVRYYGLDQKLSARLIVTSTLERLPREIDVQHVILIDRFWNVLASSDAGLFPPDEKIFYLLGDSTEAQQAWQGETATTPIRVIEGSRFKTAYAPVMDPTGGIACLLVVEANAGFFNLLLNFRKGLIIGGIASFGVLIIFAVFLVTSITLFLRTQENLRRSERLASMGQMAAAVAHEIRNPLSIIKNTSEVLRQKYDRQDQPDELFEFIPSEVRRLGRLVNDFLSFARDRELTIEQGDLIKTIQKAIAMVQQEDQAQNIEWDFQCQQNKLIIDYDDDAITQVLINLFLNSAQAMNGSGKVEIHVEESSKSHREAHLSVCDNGPGLPDSSEKIFDPFFTTKTRGSGLGLAVSKQFIEKHGGRLEAESKKGEGTTMHIWLPK